MYSSLRGISIRDFPAQFDFALRRKTNVQQPIRPLPSYNDDVAVGHYCGASDSYMSMKRPNVAIGSFGALPGW